MAAYNVLRTSSSREPPRDDAFFRMFDRRVELEFGGNVFQAVDTLISIDGKDFLKYWSTGGMPPFVISGSFTDDRGHELFRIEENEWIGPSDVFDIEQRASTFSIRRSREHLLFEAEKRADSGRVVLHVLDMLVPPFHILVLGGILYVGRCSPDLSNVIYTGFSNWNVTGGTCALSLNSSDVGSSAGGVSIGPTGFRLEGTGITIAPGGASIAIGAFFVVTLDRPENGLTGPQTFRKKIEQAIQLSRGVV